MAIKELVVDKNELLYEPRIATTIESEKSQKKKQVVKVAISGIEIFLGGILVDYFLTKKPNTNPMVDSLMIGIGLVLVYDGVKRTGYL